MREHAHGLFSGTVGHRHEQVHRAREETPGQWRGIPTGQTRHQRVDGTPGVAGAALPRTLQQAVGLLGLDHDEHRALVAVALPEMADDTGRQPTDTALHHHMGERTRPRRRRHHVFQCLARDDGVTLHHVARDVLVPVVGGVGHHLPAVVRGQARGFMHRLVVVAADAHDLRAEGGDRLFPLGADLCMQDDHAAATDAAGGRCQCPTVVAVGGADDHQVGQLRGVAAREQVCRPKCLVRPAALDQAQQGHRSAQDLETRQW